MKKILFAIIIMAAGCGKVPPAAKDYRISQKELSHEISSVYAVKDPANALYSQVSGKSDTEVAITGEGIFSDLNMNKHFTTAKNEHFLLSLVKQPGNKVTVTMAPGTQTNVNKEFSNGSSFEAEFAHGSFEDFKAGKDISRNPTANWREARQSPGRPI